VAQSINELSGLKILSGEECRITGTWDLTSDWSRRLSSSRLSRSFMVRHMEGGTVNDSRRSACTHTCNKSVQPCVSEAVSKTKLYRLNPGPSDRASLHLFLCAQLR